MPVAAFAEAPVAVPDWVRPGVLLVYYQMQEGLGGSGSGIVIVDVLPGGVLISEAMLSDLAKVGPGSEHGSCAFRPRGKCDVRPLMAEVTRFHVLESHLTD